MHTGHRRTVAKVSNGILKPRKDLMNKCYIFLQLKQGIQEFGSSRQGRICRLHFINTLKQELNGTKDYEETTIDVVNSLSNDLHYKFAVNVQERQDKLPQCIGYLGVLSKLKL